MKKSADSLDISDRQRAVTLLRRIAAEGLHATPLLAGESGFVRTLVLGVLRWRSRLDYVIDKLSEINQPIDPDVRDVLRLGIFQLLFTEIPVHAAVFESVTLAPTRGRGFANALLRRASQADLHAFGRNDVAIRTSHPRWLIARWERQFGIIRAAAIAEANQQLSFPDVIVGDTSPVNSEPSQLVEGIARLRGATPPGFYAIDEGSAVIASIAASAGGRILDLTAAPGGKTRMMARVGADVVANDISITRLRPLMGHHTRIVVSDALQPSFRRPFDTVLIDAPCSATGTIRKNPELKWRLLESALPSFAALQRQLVREALLLSSNICIYSTCSLEPEENEQVIEECKGFERIDITPFVPPGARSWVENGVLRLTPESGADGFAAFALKRV